VARHLAHQEQRRMTQFHRIARLNSERGNLICADARHEFANTRGDLRAVL
jgi:hypothetical protein